MNCEELIKGCKIFIEKEPRDTVYKCTIHELEKNRSIEIKAEILADFLRIWNERYIRTYKITLDQLRGDIKKALEESEHLKFFFDTLQIENADFNDKQLVKAIKDIFRIFLNKNAIKSTGASKILHLLFPNFFMMWDNKIRSAYHKTHNKHALGSEDCYLEFMKSMSKMAKNLIAEFSNIHKLTMEEAKEKLCKECSSKYFVVTLTKALDQFNYAKFTKNWI